MKILFFSPLVEDYLADSALIGFRELYGADCIDFPKCERLYSGCPDSITKTIRGKGFTLYTGVLADIEIDRSIIGEKVKSGYFDLIVFGDIQREFGYFVQFRPWLNLAKTIILDGQDIHQPYPAHGFWWRRRYYWLLPKAHKNFLYFKREWLPDTHFNIFLRFFPVNMRSALTNLKNVRKVSFSIPSEKIVASLRQKIKDFPKHIVDAEVAEKVPGSYTSYAFENEEEYYNDLQVSRFGITIKRAGWDCLRHYEIAANGAVICFKDLDEKPDTCAPHGLLDGVNCISYKTYDDLLTRIRKISAADYTNLQTASLKWAVENSCIAKAQQIVQTN
jgi:hypothetical protein